MGMDIGEISIEMNQTSLKNTIQVSVMKMTMDNVKETSNNMVNIIDTINIEPYKAINIDATI